MVPEAAEPSPSHQQETGRVRAIVRLPSGEFIGHCRIQIRALTPTEVRNIAYRTNPSGVIQVGLFPGTYVLIAEGMSETGQRLYGQSPELVVKVSQTVTTDVEVNYH